MGAPKKWAQTQRPSELLNPKTFLKKKGSCCCLPCRDLKKRGRGEALLPGLKATGTGTVPTPGRAVVRPRGPCNAALDLKSSWVKASHSPIGSHNKWAGARLCLGSLTQICDAEVDGPQGPHCIQPSTVVMSCSGVYIHQSLWPVPVGQPWECISTLQSL